MCWLFLVSYSFLWRFLRSTTTTTSIKTEFNTINWRDTTHFDSEDDYRTGCWNVSHYQQQQSCSGLRSPGRSYSTHLWNDSWVQTFHSNKYFFMWKWRDSLYIYYNKFATKVATRKTTIITIIIICYIKNLCINKIYWSKKFLQKGTIQSYNSVK